MLSITQTVNMDIHNYKMLVHIASDGDIKLTALTPKVFVLVLCGIILIFIMIIV